MTRNHPILPTAVILLALCVNSWAADFGTRLASTVRHAEAAPTQASRIPISDSDFVYLYPQDIFRCCTVDPYYRFVQQIHVDHSTPLRSLTIPIGFSGTHPDLVLDSTVFTPPDILGVTFGPGGHDSLWDTRQVLVNNVARTVLLQFEANTPVGPEMSDTLCYLHWLISGSFYEVGTWFIDTLALFGEHLQLVGPADTLIPSWSPGTIQVNEIGIQDDQVAQSPGVTVLVQPNPFNSQVRVHYVLQAPERVGLTVYSILGHRVRRWSSELRSAGRHECLWDGRDEQGRTVASGVYYFVLEGESNTSTSAGVMLK